MLDAPFAGTRPGYVAHDPRMREVYCELDPAPADIATEAPFIVREPSSAGPTEPVTEPAPMRHPIESTHTRNVEMDPPAAAP